MPILHRLQWIDAQIRAGRYPNAKSLAAAFEISRRQALRDLDYMRDSLGAPLAYSALHRGFTYTDQRFVLPGPYVTPAQRATLDGMAHYYGSAAERDPGYADLADLFRRLGGSGSITRRTLPQTDQPRTLTPYLARIRGPFHDQPPAALQPFFRGSPEPGLALAEFHAPEPLLEALWGAPGCRIESPRWLRERLTARAAQILQQNADEVTRHVTPTGISLAQIRRDSIMEQKQNAVSARWVPGWMSYIGAVQGILNSAGMGPWEYWKLMGSTGMAFHMVMHERCCISSVTVYDWLGTHLGALDRIGILSEVHETAPGSPTYAAAARRAVSRIKESIDNGIGVVLWGVDTGEFGIVYGYDDADGVLHASGCFGEGGKPILYENVGRTFPDAPILHYQIILEQVAFDEARAARSALQYYADLMERTSHVARGYQAGLLAYDNWIKGLQTEGFDQQGCRYAASVYADARGCAARYVAHLAESDQGLAPVAAAFQRTADIYGQILAVLDQSTFDPCYLDKPVTPDQAAALIPLLQQAKASEAETLALVQQYLKS